MKGEMLPAEGGEQDVRRRANIASLWVEWVTMPLKDAMGPSFLPPMNMIDETGDMMATEPLGEERVRHGR